MDTSLKTPATLPRPARLSTTARPVAPSLTKNLNGTFDSILPTSADVVLPSLRQGFSWTLLGNLTYAICQMGLLISLARFGGAESVGQYALGLAVVAPILLFSGLQLRAVMVTNLTDEYQFGHYLALRLTTIGLSFLVIAGLLGWSNYSSTTQLVIMLLGIAKGTETLADILYGQLQSQGRLDVIAKAQMVRGIVALLVASIALLATHNLVYTCASLAAANILLVISYDYRQVRHCLRGKTLLNWSLPALSRLAWQSAPLGVVMALISLNSNIPRYFIEQDLGSRELGIFAAMANFMTLQALIITALGQTISSNLAHAHVNQQRRTFNKLLMQSVIIAISLGSLGILASLICGEWILDLFYGPQFSEHANVFVCLMIAATFSNIVFILGFAATARQYRHRQAIALFVVVLVSIFAGKWLISHYQLYGAALTALVSSIVSVLAYIALLTFEGNKAWK